MDYENILDCTSRKEFYKWLEENHKSERNAGLNAKGENSMMMGFSTISMQCMSHCASDGSIQHTKKSTEKDFRDSLLEQPIASGES